MKIAFFESPAVDKVIIEQSFSGVEVSFFDEKLDENTVETNFFFLHEIKHKCYMELYSKERKNEAD